MKEKIDKLSELLRLETLNTQEEYKAHIQQEIISLYDEIISSLQNNYSLLNEYIYVLISIADKNESFINHIIKYYLENYYFVLKNKKLKIVPNPIKPPYDHKKSFPYYQKMCDTIINNPPIRLSRNNLNLKEYDNNLLENIYKSVLIQNALELNKHNLEPSMIPFIVVSYIIARNIALKLGYIENYYLSLGTFIDYLNRDENKQLARDTSNELLYSAHKDNLLDYGCYIYFRNFIEQKRISAALIFGTICLHNIRNNNRDLSKNFLFHIVWQTLKLFVIDQRISIAFNIYENVPNSIKNIATNRHRLDYNHFVCLLLLSDASLPNKLFMYIEENEEEILKDDLLPWLTLIYQIDSSNRFTNTYNSFPLVNLTNYIEIFENKLSKENYEKRKSIIYKEIKPIKEFYYEAFMRAKEARNKEDFPFDIKSVLDLASIIISQSVTNKDFSGFLMAMMTKSDYSLNQVNKTSDKLIESENNKYDLKLYLDSQVSPKNLSEVISENDQIIWLAQAELSVYEMSLTRDSIEFHFLKGWDINLSKSWYNNNLPTFLFDDYIKITNKSTGKTEVRRKLPEEHVQYAEAIKNTLSFARINTQEKGGILLVKDIALSEFPHNLLLNDENSYLGLLAPITDIINSDWLLSKVSENRYLETKFTISLWIPTQAGDFTLNHLYDKILDSNIHKNYNVVIDTSSTTQNLITKDINIVAAHGDTSISTIPAFFINEAEVSVVSENFLIGGNILILLVCYSGSMKPASLKSKIESFVRRYLFHGYQCVIAPFWALHIDIPPIWLPEFFNNLEDGFNISESVFLANMKIYQHYPNPEAWACMHLYGNPYYKVLIE